MDDSEGTVRQIGAFSEGIQNLTVTIQRFASTCYTIYSVDDDVSEAVNFVDEDYEKNNLQQSL